MGNNHNPQIKEFSRSHVRSAEVYQCRPSAPVQSLKPVKISKPYQTTGNQFRSTASHRVLATTTNQSFVKKFPLCQVTHSIRQCPSFREKTPSERFQVAKGAGHSSASCPSKQKCQSCQKSHHTMLHFPSPSQGSMFSSNKDSEIQPSTSSLMVRGQPRQAVLFATVLLNVCANDGRIHVYRAFLDSGSQASLITEKAASTLMLPRRQSSIHIFTFTNSASTRVRGKTIISITPRGKKCRRLVWKHLYFGRLLEWFCKILSPLVSGNTLHHYHLLIHTMVFSDRLTYYWMPTYFHHLFLMVSGVVKQGNL